MGLFDFLKNWRIKKVYTGPTPDSINRSHWTGINFEFLIIGEVEIPSEDYDEIITPNSIGWEKVVRDGWPYYKVGDDEFSYSHEIPGIQMTFNSNVTFIKAKSIADEVIENIESSGRKPELVIIDKNTITGH